MSRIPTYALYGEFNDDLSADWIHCETIQSRSRLHNYRIEPHRHERLFQILHITSGAADILVDNRAVTLVAPCIVTLPPMVVHGYTFSRDIVGSVLTLFENRLDPILRGMIGDMQTRFQEAQLVSLAPHPAIARTIAMDLGIVGAEFEGRAPGRLGAIEARLALVMIALDRIQGSAVHPRGPHARALDHAMRFRQMVDHDYRDHVSIATYAQRLGLTPTHLNRICNEHLGASALGIVHKRLVLEAKRYLTFTSLSAKEIALSLSFEDPAYFTRFFKRETGMSPIAFRTRQRSTVL